MRLLDLALSVSTSIILLPLLILDRNRALCSAEESLQEPVNVAIIGSGIGGSASAYFARQLFGPEAQIDVYEASDRIGGRLDVIKVSGKSYEAGGSIIHEKNKHMEDFVKQLGLKKLKSSEGSLLGIYNGADFDFLGSRWKFLNYAKLLWRYGFDLITINKWVKTMLGSFNNIYDLQTEGKAFSNVEELLTAIGGKELAGLTKKTTREELQKLGIKDLTIDELVTGAMRMNYGQDVTLNAFAGSVSMAGMEGGLWSVEGGNWKVCEALLKASRATLFKDTKVSQITKVTEEKPPSYTIITNVGKRNSYDVVIVAAPLAVRDYYFPCPLCTEWPKPSSTQQFWQTVATFVQGQINLKYFGFAKVEDFPDGVFTTETPKNFFNSIGLQQPVQDRQLADNKEKPVRKVFSRQPLTQEQIEHFFPVKNDVEQVVWLAYPDLKPAEHFSSFVLDDGIFYVNAIENAASAMEMSCVGAKNAALLAHQYYTKQEQAITERKGKKKRLSDEL